MEFLGFPLDSRSTWMESFTYQPVYQDRKVYLELLEPQEHKVRKVHKDFPEQTE
jgi:hypothetical protein